MITKISDTMYCDFGVIAYITRLDDGAILISVDGNPLAVPSGDRADALWDKWEKWYKSNSLSKESL